MKRYFLQVVGVILMGLIAQAKAEEAAPKNAPSPDPAPVVQPVPVKVSIDRLNVSGTIEKANISFTLEFDAVVKEPKQELPLVVGQMTLSQLEQPKEGYTLRYDQAANTYYMGWREKGTHHVKAMFAARAEPMGKEGWHEAVFAIPAAQVRKLDVACDRTDLEVQFPDAMRVERNTQDGKLVISAILGPGKPFIVRFKPQVQQMEAKLVFSSQANIITTVSAATVQMDALFIFDVAQGSLSEMKFKLPPSLNVTQVRGLFIQDWSIAGTGKDRTLRVTINRPQTAQYALQVQGEQSVPALPCDLESPVIEPLGGLRASGHLAVGTGSAIQMLVAKSAGLTQIDVKAFPRVAMDVDHLRAMPANKTFSYTYAASPYLMAMRLDNITPTFDATYRQNVTVKDEDFTIDSDITLDVRDAPLRDLVILAPRGFQVAAVTGAMVDDYRVETDRSNTGAKAATTQPDSGATRIRVQFKKPVLGKTNLALRLELGHGPLDDDQTVSAISLVGAKTQRGFLAVAADDGLQLDVKKMTNLREVNVASLEVIPPDARLAYRFRENDWTLTVKAIKKPAAIRTESFHLISLGEGRAYGSVAISYFITGSPVDKLQFKLPQTLHNVQFVGRDVRRAVQNGELWTVHLQRRVIGDYNIGLTFDLPYETKGKIPAGVVQCEGVETQTGYIAVTSHLNLELEPVGQPSPALLEIAQQEVPGNYRILATAPILKTYKYVGTPHDIDLNVKAYDQGEVVPAVVEVMDANTRLAVMEDNRTESVTTIRYKIKNTSRQFLVLQMPPGATVWTTRLIERQDDGRETATRLAASVDPKIGLMIPLPRHRNPNDPITIELEYGQTHGVPGAWATNVSLTAPSNGIPASFATWNVSVPSDYSITPAETGNMVPAAIVQQSHGIVRVLNIVGRAWSWAVSSETNRMGVLVVVIAYMVLCGILGIFFRRALPGMILGLGAAILLGLGVLCTISPSFRHELNVSTQTTTLQFTRAVTLPDQGGLTVAVHSVPAWRQHLSMRTAIVVPVGLLVLAILAGKFRRLRKLCMAAAMTGICYAAAEISPLVAPLGHALTWGIPLLLLLGFISFRLIPLLRHAPAKSAVAAMLLIGLLLATGGCSNLSTVKNFMAESPVIERIDYKLSVEKDSLAVGCVMKVSAPAAADFALMDESAVLMSGAAPDKNIAIELQDGMHHVKIKTPGNYEVHADFLYPLAAADINRTRKFSLFMPLALSNGVELTVPETDVEIISPTAFRCEQQDADGNAIARVIMPPGKPMEFLWKPRARQTQREEIKFYSQVTSVACFDASLVSILHDVRLQVAQGELHQLRITIPSETAVTAVNGASIGAWRYDPGTRELEVRFAKPVTGDYSLKLVTQAAVATLPYSFDVHPIIIKETQRQRTLLGLVNSAEVFVEASGKPQAVNVDDFARDAAPLIKETSAASITPAFAYRLDSDFVSVRTSVVNPELRLDETATFNVMDERLVYNGRLDVQIAKTGMFSIQLVVPAVYDIDALSTPQLSHWDETVEAGQRTITVHFTQKTIGVVPVALTLSQPISQLPDKITVPHVELVGSLRHTGQAVLRAERGVRLTVADRQGVTEINPLELSIRESGVLAFRLLKPNWSIALQAESIEPLVNVDMLHIARVSDGMVQHQNFMRYRLFHAGTKTLSFQLPPDALGVTITGPDIARRQQVKPGLWRIELAKKWFDAPYPLQISYQTRFEREPGAVNIRSVEAMGADQQRGHVVVYTTDRVELRPGTVPASLQPAEARNVPGREFGAGDLSDAVYCYSVSTPNYVLPLNAVRHAAAVQIEAEVNSTEIRTVVAESGQSINRVHLAMTVGSKRYLRCWLPNGAELWSLLVNGRAAVPSRQATNGRSVLLIPLTQAAGQDMEVQVDLVYVLSPSNPISNWIGQRSFGGPQFDLPLKNIQWLFYLPEGFNYDEFKGNLAIKQDSNKEPVVLRYDLAQYEQSVTRFNYIGNKKAMEYQSMAQKLAQEGKQYGARELLEQARTYSLSDSALNEDINVDLGNLLRQQAKVGLVGSRDRLRRQMPGASGESAPGAGEIGDKFNRQQAEQIESALSKADSENLDLISRRMIEMQEAAAGNRVQLLIEMPQRGRMIEFTRPLLVEPDSPLDLAFMANTTVSQMLPASWLWSIGLFVALSLVIYLWPGIRNMIGRMGKSSPTTTSLADNRPISANELVANSSVPS